MRPTPRTSALALLALCQIALASAAPASAGTVSVAETKSSPTSGEVLVDFRSSPGEGNRLAVTVAGGSGHTLTLSFQDSGAPLEAGAGCSGGGPATSTVICNVQEPRSYALNGCTKVLPCYEGEAWHGAMSIDLGDGINAFDAGSFTQPFDGRFDMTVSSGPGDDRIATGSGEDLIVPGAGADEVFSGHGYDRVEATPEPDGPDVYDLGRDDLYLGEVSYRLRSTPVELHGRRAGARGEDDALIEVDTVTGGKGDDLLAARRGIVLLRGGPGDDVLQGSPGPDSLKGGSGRDSLSGGRGKDRLVGDDGADRLDGGRGADVADCGKGDDLLVFDRADRSERCERVRR